MACGLCGKHLVDVLAITQARTSIYLLDNAPMVIISSIIAFDDIRKRTEASFLTVLVVVGLVSIFLLQPFSVKGEVYRSLLVQRVTKFFYNRLYLLFRTYLGAIVACDPINTSLISDFLETSWLGCFFLHVK